MIIDNKQTALQDKKRRKMMSKQSIIILSSGESIETANILQTTLSGWLFPEIWTQGIFELTKTNIESLDKNKPSYDYCIILLTPDDINISREIQYRHREII